MTAAAALPERRLNLLTGDWVLVSPHRLSRPWQGAVADQPAHAAAKHDPNCHLCPTNRRIGGAANPDYSGVWVFENDFPALLAAGSPSGVGSDPILVSEPESGICRVICYSPEHDQAMARMPITAIRRLVDVWAAQTTELSARPDIGAITLFENRGEMMGASSPHPHGQIWATASVPNELQREDERQRLWLGKHGKPLLDAYLERELSDPVRIVFSNLNFVVLVPYWAAWPFETLVLPRRCVGALDELSDAERNDFAEALGHLSRCYDALFATPFPYTMGIHQRPPKLADDRHFTLHAHYFPPLLRSASIRKFMVGFEMLAMPQRDLTPEAAADRLRSALRS
jgi:UDPglucose--hexose-1-phosphate uridylyltransferase